MKTTKMQISIPPKLRDEFDTRVVQANYSSRSAEIRRLMAARLQQLEERKN